MRDMNVQACTPSRSRLDLDGSSQQSDALIDADQSEAVLLPAYLHFVETFAVVADR
jgi:hypothetical protein